MPNNHTEQYKIKDLMATGLTTFKTMETLKTLNALANPFGDLMTVTKLFQPSSTLKTVMQWHTSYENTISSIANSFFKPLATMRDFQACAGYMSTTSMLNTALDKSYVIEPLKQLKTLEAQAIQTAEMSEFIKPISAINTVIDSLKVVASFNTPLSIKFNATHESIKFSKNLRAHLESINYASSPIKQIMDNIQNIDAQFDKAFTDQYTILNNAVLQKETHPRSGSLKKTGSTGYDHENIHTLLERIVFFINVTQQNEKDTFKKDGKSVVLNILSNFLYEVLRFIFYYGLAQALNQNVVLEKISIPGKDGGQLEIQEFSNVCLVKRGFFNAYIRITETSGEDIIVRIPNPKLSAPAWVRTKIPARTLNRKKSKIVELLSPYQQVAILGKQKKWVHVSWFSPFVMTMQSGWIPSHYLIKIKPSIC